MKFGFLMPGAEGVWNEGDLVDDSRISGRTNALTTLCLFAAGTLPVPPAQRLKALRNTR